MIARRRLKAEAQTLGIPVTKVIRDDGIFMLNPVDLDVLRDQGGGEAHPELINQSVHQRRALMSSWSMFRMRKTRPHCLSSAPIPEDPRTARPASREYVLWAGRSFRETSRAASASLRSAATNAAADRSALFGGKLRCEKGVMFSIPRLNSVAFERNTGHRLSKASHGCND